MVIKGQNLRIFLNNEVLAMSLSAEVQIGTVLKDVSNKDTVGGWTENKVVAQNWSVRAECVICTGISYGVTLDELESMVGQRFQIDFALADGEHNADKGDMLVTGYAILNDVQITAEKRKRGICDLQFTGQGRLTIPRILADVNGVVLITADGYALAV